MLPLKELSHPTAAPLNLVTHLPDTTRQPDLGPKSYIAYGRYTLAAATGCRSTRTARIDPPNQSYI